MPGSTHSTSAYWAYDKTIDSDFNIIITIESVIAKPT